MAKKEENQTCPFCGGDSMSVEDGAVECLDCHATGPIASNDDKAIKAWNHRDGDGEPATVAHIEETPELNGARMVLRYGNQELCVVEFVHEDYLATMRGALTLIGGMRSAEDNEHVG